MAARKKLEKLHFQYDSGYVHVFKFDPEEDDYILAIVLDPDGEIEEGGQHRDGRFVEITPKELNDSRAWQLSAQKRNRAKRGGLHSE